MYRDPYKNQVMWNMKYIVCEGHFYFKEYQITQLTSHS